MALQGEVLIFKDARALAHWLGGALPRAPGLLARPCIALGLVPEGGGPQSLGILLEGAPAGILPRPAEGSQDRARLVVAEVDLEAKRLKVLGGKGGILRRQSVAETFTIEEAAQRANLVQAVPLEPWTREPEDPEVIFLAPPGDAFSGLVTEHLELGRDQLRFAATQDQELGPRLLIDVARPSWFLLERWADGTNGHSGVTAFRRLPRRRVYVAWGKKHPLESFVAEPEANQILLIDGDGRYRTLKIAAWKDVGEVLALEAAKLDTQPLEAARTPGRIPVRLRLEGRPKPRDPELWLLPAEERGRLERLLAQTPEEELKNLLVTLVERAGAAGSAPRKFFVVREVLAGRAARSLPIGGQVYACIPGLPGLFCPCDRTIAPPLRNDRYSRAFGVKPGEITLLDEKEDGGILVSKIEEASFRPIDTVIDFVVEGDAARLQALIAQTPFELGRFAEEDLVSPEGAPDGRRKGAGKEPKDPRDAQADETPGAQPKEGILNSIKGIFQPKERDHGSRTARSKEPKEDDARRAVIANLERELARDPNDVARWWRLAEMRFEDQDEEDAVSGYENALWLTRDDANETELRSRLAERLGDAGTAAPADAPGLYRSVFAYSTTVASTQDPDVYRALTSQIHEQLRLNETRLRKKGRWLLWREVLKLTKDQVEEERQREDVLADLVLRGVEDREVPAFVRRRLLERYSTAAEQGAAGRTTEAIAFLRDAEGFADATDKPAHRAAAIAHVAWAYAELGEATRAKELARAAERHANEAKGETDQAYRARALARAAAVFERTDGPNAGRRLFQEALAAIGRGLESRPTRSAEERKAFPKWFQALADARGSHATVDDPLVGQGILLLEKVEPNLRALLLDECAEPLSRLGQAAKGRQLARALLARSDLQLIHLEHAAEALETFEDGRAVVVEDGRRILDVVRRAPAEIDEFAPDMIIIALRAEQRHPWEVADEVAQSVQKEHPYAAALLRLTALQRLAELKDRERGPRLLARMFEDAWAHTGDTAGLERMRLLVRLAKLVPAFGLRGQGLETLRGIADKAQQERSLYVRNELLSACILAAAKLGETRETMRVLEEIVDQVLAVLRDARRDARTANSFLFEALDAAATGAAEIGDAQRGLLLVEKVAKAARDELSRPSESRTGGPEAAGRFFFYRALIRCGRAATALGDRDAAQGHFDDALSRLGETFGCDRIDLLEDAAKAANELEGERRYSLASQVLKLARDVLDLGEFSRQFAVELAERVAQDVVRGESAFAAALKRWKGDEERRIRDRVATERVCPEG